MRVLDAGCGTGKECLKWFPNAEIIGIDIEMGIDMNKPLIFADNSFDVVFSNHTIEHLSDPDTFIQEAYRILKPGGKIIINTPNIAWWCSRIALLLGYQPYWTETSTTYQHNKLFNVEKSCAGHLRLYTPRALKQLVEAYGFKTKSLKTTPSNTLGRFWWLMPIERMAIGMRSQIKYGGEK